MKRNLKIAKTEIDALRKYDPRSQDTFWLFVTVERLTFALLDRDTNLKIREVFNEARKDAESDAPIEMIRVACKSAALRCADLAAEKVAELELAALNR